MASRTDKFVYGLAHILILQEEEPSKVKRTVNALTREIFTDLSDRDIYDVMCQHVKAGKPLDIVSITDTVCSRDNLSNLPAISESLSSITSASASSLTKTRLVYYKALVEDSKKYKASIQSKELQKDVPVADVVGKLQEIVKEIDTDYPFKTRDGKSWVSVSNQDVEAFRWDSVECDYQIENDCGMVVSGLFTVSGDINGIIEVCTDELNDRVAFRKALVTRFHRNKYIDSSYKVMRTIKSRESVEREVMDIMSDYFIKQMEICTKRAVDLPGWGNVSRIGHEGRPSVFTNTKWIDFWNFGNKILVKIMTDKGERICKVYDYQEVLPVFPNKKAYRFENFTDKYYNDFSVVENPRLKDKLKFIHDAWGSAGIMALSWLVYHGFYKYIREQNEKVSILYISGESGSGKTTLAEILLACCGMHGALSRSAMTINQSQGGISNSALQKYAAHTHSIPLYMDEAEKPEHGQTSRSFMQLLGLFDGTGAKRSKRTADGGLDNVIDSPKHAGAIYTGIRPPSATEYINRCTMIELPAKHLMNDAKFAKHKADLSGFSSFLFDVMSRIDHTEYIAEVNRYRLYLINEVTFDAQSREINSLAGVYTAYKLLVKYGYIDDCLTDKDFLCGIEQSVETRKLVYAPDALVKCILAMSDTRYLDINIGDYISRTDNDMTGYIELNVRLSEVVFQHKLYEVYKKYQSDIGIIAINDLKKLLFHSKWFDPNLPSSLIDQPKGKSLSSYQSKWYPGNYVIDESNNKKTKDGKYDIPIPTNVYRYYRFIIPYSDIDSELLIIPDNGDTAPEGL